jgi:hypothetical protein
MKRRELPHYEWDMEWGNVFHKRVTPLQAIRMHCLACMGGHEDAWPLSDGTSEPRYRPYQDVRECASKTCWLYPYRTGRNPRAARKTRGRSENLENTPKMSGKSSSESHASAHEGQ